VSGPGIDYFAAEQRSMMELEAQGDEVNGEQVREAVERKKVVESGKAVLAGAAFAMGVVGLWGDGA